MSQEEVLKAIDDAIKSLEKEPTSEQIAFENGCRYTINTFQYLLNYCEKLEKENKILRENAEHNDKVVDKVNWENRLLKDKINKATKYINEWNIVPCGAVKNRQAILDLLNGDKPKD